MFKSTVDYKTYNVSEVTGGAALRLVGRDVNHSVIKIRDQGPGGNKQGSVQNDKGPSESETSHCSQQ